MFIEVMNCDDGKRRVINADWITEVVESEDGTIIWIDNCFDKITCEESYEDIRDMLME